MESADRNPEVAAAIESIDASVEVLLSDDWVPAGPDEAMVRVREFEVLERRLHAARLGVQDRIGRSGVHRVDGHASAKVMVRFAANLSNAEALRRTTGVRVMRDMPDVAAGHAAGRIGAPQVELVGRVLANARVAGLLVEADAQVARAAAMLPYPEFEAGLGARRR